MLILSQILSGKSRWAIECTGLKLKGKFRLGHEKEWAYLTARLGKGSEVAVPRVKHSARGTGGQYLLRIQALNY